ncbi:uncharacterized protein [Aegilops tauschii subsp. strangulata]|uniref:uncharacterized protein n=1 Tax=Aegilops tauschii subsp. strangulata TaxID=200361 RepID=UPI000989E559|nr:uncharacterized protein LOC109738522 [Aegilops tauschii subsp. strangulata]
MEQVLATVPRKVTPDMNLALNAPYSQEEVKNALFQMFPTKAPGPDGFPAHFFQRHWEICKDEVTNVVLKIVEGNESAESINETVLVLTPKIASKVIANRLKVVLPDIISEEQSAFVPGRLITDNIITAYECLHFMKRNKAKKHQSCALKLDMMKAYDRLEWPYLRAIMLKLGFTNRWVDIVMSLVTTVKFSVMFNGKKLEEFEPSRGIRQGDPISPYLFLLAAEGLSCLLKSRRESSNLQGLQVAPSAPPVNHLLFADDSLLFFKANGEGANEVNLVLDQYCQASGQRVNNAKSSIFFSKGVPDSTRQDIKNLLNVQNETLNEKYLARQAWRLLLNPDSLSGRILKGVYFPNSIILEAELGTHPSQIWRAVIEGRDTLKLGLIKRIGNGQSTNIWTDNWLPRDEMLHPYGSVSPNPPTFVAELIDPTSASWIRERVEEVFMPMDVPIILGIPLCTRNIPDFWSWNFEKKGNFTVKSAYRMLVTIKQRREAWLEGNAGPSRTAAEENSWKNLWKIKVPGKVRMFLWRLSKQSLPTNDVRAHRHMTDSPACGICGSPDSWRHSLVNCTMSRCIWALVDDEMAQQLISTTEPSAKNWLFTLMELLSHEMFVKLSVTLWAIWTARRKAIHEGIFQSPHATYSFVNRYIEELGMISGKEETRLTEPPVQGRAPRPRRPPTGFHKIHVDAATRQGRGGAVSAVCRDGNGNFVGSSALVIIGVQDPATLEAIAVREALSLVADMHIQNLVVFSDCKQVIMDIKSDSAGRYGAIIKEVKLQATFFNCNFIFESHRVNVEAHKLAKYSLILGPGRHIWFGHSHDQRCIPHSVVYDE